MCARDALDRSSDHTSWLPLAFCRCLPPLCQPLTGPSAQLTRRLLRPPNHPSSSSLSCAHTPQRPAFRQVFISGSLLLQLPSIHLICLIHHRVCDRKALSYCHHYPILTVASVTGKLFRVVIVCSVIEQTLVLLYHLHLFIY
jgi:hypothetical protein